MVAAIALPVAGQEIGVEAVAWEPRGEGPIRARGYQVRFGSDAVTVAGARLHREVRTSGVPCGGLIFDAVRCASQPIDYRIDAWRATIGHTMRSLTHSWRFELAPTVGALWLRTQKLGLVTGAELHGDGAGLEVSLSAAALRRVMSSRLTASASVSGSVLILMPQRCLDCIVPFSTFLATEASLGFRYQWRR